MTYQGFGRKQLKILSWWMDKSPYKDRDAIIADGAVRSGKTLCMSLSFVMWAMNRFDGCAFAICGKSISACERNVIRPLQAVVQDSLKMKFRYSRVRGYIEISNGKHTNIFYVFGGKDEGSAALIQGVTLAGLLLDEVALMPRSFVEQALARCSVTGSKFWFNCNPESPMHWFYIEWICKAKEKNAYHIHFLMDDNPSLSDEIRERYHSLYTGTFYDRYVLGKWVKAEGLVYPMFDQLTHIYPNPKHPKTPQSALNYISIDYGTVNPFSAGKWRICGGVAYRMKEYYFDSRREGTQKTDEEYADEVERLIGNDVIQYCVVDPSAASFIRCLRRRGIPVRQANNDVLDGIRYMSGYMKMGRLQIHESCKDFIRETGLYSWDSDKPQDTPIKEHDHAMDEGRYMCITVLSREWAHLNREG